MEFNEINSMLINLTEVKNVILLIGDGMGVTQVYAGMSVARDNMNIERSQVIGFSKTYSASHYTTDSGAGATAISTGKKTVKTLTKISPTISIITVFLIFTIYFLIITWVYCYYADNTSGWDGTQKHSYLFIPKR